MYLKQKSAFILSLLLFALPGVSIADHSWGSYKWKVSSLPFNLNLGDNVDSTWDGHLLGASTDWSVSTVIDTTVVAGSTAADPLSCSAENGNVQVCNAEYGQTNWLGLAQIYIRDSTITAGLAKLNDTYFNTANYNTPAWRQMVMCQEVAHTFGLSHQDETFDNVNLGSCMDYTSDPGGTLEGNLSNEYPNQHDFDQLVAIYTDSKGSGCNPKSPKCSAGFSAGNSAHSNAEWGRLVSRHGGAETYEKVLGNGNRLLTFVTWTLEHTDSH